jgi:hypothetical protein
VTELRKRMLEDLQIRNYAPTTVAAYIRGVAEFAKHFGKSPDLLGTEQIREYQLYLIKEKKVSLSSYIQAVCALRFLYSNTLHVPVSVDRIPLPRYEKKLPVILSPAEVKLLLEAPKDLAYRTMLSTMYATGVRRQRPQGSTRIAAAQASRVAPNLFPLEKAQRLALPRRETRLSHHLQVYFSGLQTGRAGRRHFQIGSPALAATRLCHSPVGCGC